MEIIFRSSIVALERLFNNSKIDFLWIFKNCQFSDKLWTNPNIKFSTWQFFFIKFSVIPFLSFNTINHKNCPSKTLEYSKNQNPIGKFHKLCKKKFRKIIEIYKSHFIRKTFILNFPTLKSKKKQLVKNHTNEMKEMKIDCRELW